MATFDNRYEQEKLLGQGAFSEVWKVKDNQTGVTLALKIYNPTTGAGEDGNEMLTHEFALMVNANHKNLLRPLFFASCDNRPYLILPYCEKGNIGKKIGKMTEEEAWKLLRDCASGLAYLHAMNPPILHQDIKPANILLSDNGDYMLTDFGVSTQVKASLSRVSNQDLALYSAGTISYMAPERFSRNNLPVMANDIYSLGSTVYEMLTGFLPFGNDGGLLQKKGAEVPELQGDFSPLLKRTVEDCLAEETWDRPTAEQLEEIATRAIRHPELRQKVAPRQEEAARPTTMQIPEEYLQATQTSKTDQTNDVKGTVVGAAPSTNEQPGHQKPKTLLYAIIGVVAAIIVIGAIWLFSTSYNSNETDRMEPVIDADSLMRIAEITEFEASMQLFTQQNADSVKSALIRMTALAEKGNQQAIHEVAYTYAWIPTEAESNRRKHLLGWNLDKDGIPTSKDINDQAINWLEKAAKSSNLTDYKALYWLSFYYLNGINVKQDYNEASQLLERAREEANKQQDASFKAQIEDIINQLKQVQ